MAKYICIPQKVRKVFVTSIFDQFGHDSGNIFGCLDSSKQYILNATFGTSIAHQMSVLERLEKLNISKIRLLDLHRKLSTLYQF